MTIRLIFKETCYLCLILKDFDQGELLKCIKKLVSLDAEWVPYSDQCSLYIRPSAIGTEVKGRKKEGKSGQEKGGGSERDRGVCCRRYNYGYFFFNSIISTVRCFIFILVPRNVSTLQLKLFLAHLLFFFLLV